MKLLLIEDSAADVALVEAHLAEGLQGARIDAEARLSDGLARLGAARYDAVLLDLGLPDSRGLVGLEHVLSTPDAPPVIVLTGLDDLRLGIDAVKAGAQDYVLKQSIGSGSLVKALHHARERHELQNALHQQAARLSRSEANFRGIANNADGLVILDDANRIQWANDAAAGLLGASEPLSLLGRSFPHPSAAGQEHTFGVKERVLQMRVVDTEWQGEDARLGSIRDVSRQVRAEEDLIQAQKMSLLGRLAGGIAHDFSNVLTGLMGTADLLEEHVSHDPVARRHVEDLLRDLALAGRLTSHLRSFGRQQVVAPEPVDANLLVEETAPLLTKLVGERVNLDVDLQPGLPLVRADPVQLEQVLLNLVTNARDAIDGDGTIRIGTATRGDSAVEFTVEDDGRGMDEATLERATEAFFSTGSGSSRGAGPAMGLGLSTVQDIVDRSLGDLKITSTPGVGTRVRVVLPSTRRAGLASLRSAEHRRAVRPTETVLVVDDEGVVRNVLSRALERRGYRVLTASSGPAALDRVLGYAGPLHLLITDVMMPEMDGRELATRLRTLRPDLQVLFISGYEERILAPTGALNDDMAFLAKPFRMDQALRAVRAVLDGPDGGSSDRSLEDATAPAAKP